MPSADLVILSTRVVTPEGTAPGAVVIADGVIVAIYDHGAAPDAARRLDVGNAVLLPGAVDTHVHVNEPGRTEWEGFATATRARGRDLGDVARWCAERPAGLAGLARKGRIAPGCDADVIVFDPEARFTVAPERLRQRHPVTPYAGMVLHGVVRQTFVRGTSVYEEGVFPGGAIGRWKR